MPKDWTELDESTFYLHADITGRIDTYRRSRPRKTGFAAFIARIFFLS